MYYMSIYYCNLPDQKHCKHNEKSPVAYFLTLFNKLYFRCSRYHLNALQSDDALR